MHPSRLALSISAICALASPAAASGTDLAYEPPDSPLPLSLEGAQFWLGGSFARGEVKTFKLDVAEGGKRLRVAYDTPSRTSSFTIALLDPTGASRASRSGSNAFNAEAFFTAPAGQTVASGRWTVQVTDTAGEGARARLRAKLEAVLPTPQAGADGPKRPLLPNFRAVPPYEFGFVAPANPLNSQYPSDAQNPPLEVTGQAPFSCAFDEMAPTEAGGGDAKTCLRLTTGPINIGEGPFIKTFRFQDDVKAGRVSPPVLRGEATQVIHWTDGSTTTRPAGTYSWHVSHAHFHDDGVLTYELFRVAGKTLVPAGSGTKSGFCPADQLIGMWRSFSQMPRGDFGEGDTPTGSCMSTSDGRLALTSGWGDVYRWQRPGQYVEFNGNGDGIYVVRSTVDKSNTTLESDETDNAAYALIQVRGKEVEIVERGWGTSHLDPNKQVFTGFGPASQDPYGALPES